MQNLRFTFRMLKRNPLLVFVTIPGLAIGLSAVLLLTVYLKHELSYDRHFPTKDRVLRLYNKVTEKGQTTVYGIGLREACTQIPSQVPEVETATQIYGGRQWQVNVKSGDRQFPSLNILYADSGFFDVFGLNLIAGDEKNALAGENQVVLTSSTATKIFNRLDCIGQVVRISDKPFTVTGVVRDLPEETHFTFDLLASLQTWHPDEWGSLEFFTYFLIDKNASPEEAGKKIAAANTKLLKSWGEKFNVKVESGTELLSRIHLHSIVDFDLSPKGSMITIGIVAGIAFFILLIALVNYINLYILHGEKRIAEIASRKSLGANSKSLAGMFYTETGIIGFISLILAVLLTLVVQPYFSALMQFPAGISELLSPAGILLTLAFLAALVLISGAYPTFYLSRINLVNALKGKANQVKRKNGLSVASVLVQFSITVFLISSLVVIQAQVSYLKDIPLGFNPEHVIEISEYSSEMRTKYENIHEELSRLPFVEGVGSSYARMGGGGSGQGIKAYGTTHDYSSIDEYRVQPGFCETMQMELLEGQFFATGERDKMSVILNEAAVKMLGLENPVGTQVLMSMFQEPMEVIGVVKDFYHVAHPGEPIEPLALTAYSDGVSRSYLRIAGDFTLDRYNQVAEILKRYDPEFIFGYSPLDAVYTAKFGNEERVMRLVSTGTFLAILISFVGLMALSLMHVSRRTKEIGIRKVTGSTVAEVMIRLLRQSVILVFISCVIAFGPGYLAMEQWLGNFSDKITLHAGYFLLSGLFALFFALLAVSWQSWKAATRNPVEALRYE